MNRRDFIVTAPALAVSAASAQAMVNAVPIKVRDSQDLNEVQTMSASLKTAKTVLQTGTVIHVEAGVYTLHDTFRITRSNFAIIAEPGTKIMLAEHVNKPVLAIGTQQEAPGRTDLIENVYISGLIIDGNKAFQDSESASDANWIRNNGIDVRAVKRLTIENVVSSNNRSGGLVVSWGSSDIYVLNSEFDNNFFDGVAYYDSARIYTTNVSMKHNNGAGISLDNALSDSVFSNCIIDSNQDVGIFARNSKELRFSNCVIKNSGNYAAFLSHDDSNNGVHDLVFSSCHVLNNRGGFFFCSLNDAQSSFNSVVGTVFRGNEQADRKNIQTSGTRIWESANLMLV